MVTSEFIQQGDIEREKFNENDIPVRLRVLLDIVPVRLSILLEITLDSPKIHDFKVRPYFLFLPFLVILYILLLCIQVEIIND